MGASARWFKALIGVKKSFKTSRGDQIDIKNSTNEKSKRWLLWKRGSDKSGREAKEENQLTSGIAIATTDAADDEAPADATPAAAAVGAVCIASEHSRLAFQALQKEWAAVRIQAGFRRFLARRAYRALKALVRLQAIVRGRQVRRHAALTLRCMQALVRVQARVRARCVRMSKEGQAVQQKINQRRSFGAQLRLSEKGWCDSQGTVEEIQARLQQKHEAAIKRERAMAYALSHQRAKSRSSYQAFMRYEPEKSHWGWCWLERWMAARPWENRLLEQNLKESFNLKGYDEGFQVKVGRNKVTVRIIPSFMCGTLSYSAQFFHETELYPSMQGSCKQIEGSPSAAACEEGKSSRFNGLLLSNSASNLTGKPGTGNKPAAKPGYMEATVSVRAKSRTLSDPPKIQLMFDDLDDLDAKARYVPPYLDGKVLACKFGLC